MKWHPIRFYPTSGPVDLLHLVSVLGRQGRLADALELRKVAFQVSEMPRKRITHQVYAHLEYTVDVQVLSVRIEHSY